MSATATISDYRRDARRIRAIHRNDPAKVQQALKKLVAGSVPAPQIITPPTPSKIDWTTSAILGHRTPQARLFADRVALQLLDGILPYTHRQNLISQAALMGIQRFEANLIIAAVQHRLRQPIAAEKPRPTGRLKYLAMLVAVELAIVLSVGYLLF